ncbi:N-acetyltransferase family protein [Bacillus sp. FJAT-52991]|uniref:N-acetyltransferase family protein n=1 Tax=Bacillus kandeliae TaxID=3129297 RepID=A0ABZ2N6X0_9BACI
MIRAAIEQDLVEILDIYNEAIINTTAVYDYTPHSLQDRSLWYQKKKEENDPVIVYEEEGKVMGFATFGPFRNWPAYQYTIEHSVYVGTNGKHKGIGTALLHELIKMAKGQDYVTMVAGIDDTNIASIKLHEKLGFKYAGTITKAGYKFNKWLNLSFYQLDLSD